MQGNSKWDKFLQELANIVFFWIFCVMFFLLFRISFILMNHNEIGTSIRFGEYFDVFFMGFRFDVTVSAYFLVLPFVSLLLLSPFGRVKLIAKIRRGFQFLFIILSTLICVTTLNYYREYNDQFNHFLFLGLYDDQKAVLKTVLEDFNPFLNIGIVTLILIISFKIFKYFKNKTVVLNVLRKNVKLPYKIALVVLSLLCFVGSIRGGLGKNPAMRKWASVSSDGFLNKTIINPFRSLNYAIKDFKSLNELSGDNPYGVFEVTNKSSSIVTEILKKSAKGATIEKPKQIFLVVMESYDSWPLLDKYKGFGLSGRLKSIESKGMSFPNFLPSAESTLNSFGAITTGVPYVGVNINQIGAINPPFKSSIFEQFKKLGYKTNFFYGGFLSWQNVGGLIKNQGADNLYSAPNAGGKTDSGVWGIEDEKLFDLVYNTVDKNTNSINVILTTSYHPPYKIDVYEKGFKYKGKEDLPIDAQQLYTGAMSFKALGHLWYSDKAIGDFVDKAETKFPEALFCFTGDHFGRRFVNSKPNLYEKSTVPFILYGKGITPKVNSSPGSHIDIAPTLIEMIAPKDFNYYSFGNSLLLKGKQKIGIAYSKVITNNRLLKFNHAANNQVFKFKDLEVISEIDLKIKHDNLLKMAWNYTVKGDSIQ